MQGLRFGIWFLWLRVKDRQLLWHSICNIYIYIYIDIYACMPGGGGRTPFQNNTFTTAADINISENSDNTAMYSVSSGSRSGYDVLVSKRS